MTEKTLIVELMVGPQGRVVIPANLRRAWQLTTGEVLMAHLENDRLILEKLPRLPSVRRLAMRVC